MYHHKSGSLKRKERTDREQRNLIAQKGQATLSHFNFCLKETSGGSANRSHDLTERRSSQSFPHASTSATTEPDCNQDENSVTFVSSDLVQENLPVETNINIAQRIRSRLSYISYRDPSVEYMQVYLSHVNT